MHQSLIFQGLSYGRFEPDTVKPFKDLYSGDFGSGAIQPGKTYTFLFTQQASTPYLCKVHPWMTGEIDIEHGALTS